MDPNTEQRQEETQQQSQQYPYTKQQGSKLETQDAGRKANELTKEHGLLKRTAGKFKADCTFWYNGKESHHEAECTREMILGGRFLMENFKGNFDGDDFQGHMMLGYSNGEFRETWMDNKSNELYISKGKSAKGSDNVFEVSSEQPYMDECSGKMKTSRHRHTIKSDDEILFETFDRIEGAPEERSMHIVYRRMKDTPAA